MTVQRPTLRSQMEEKLNSENDNIGPARDGGMTHCNLTDFNKH